MPAWAKRSLLFVCAALFATSCRSQPDPALEVRIGVRADVTGIFPNPPIVNEGFTFGISMHLFEGLTALDRSQRVVPALADGWETSSDTSYVFQLRRDLRFSDGRPVTAEDVVASLEAASARPWINRDWLQTIASVRALDERRIEVRTQKPDLALPYELPRGFVLPKDAVDQDPVPAIGTGPYRLESWLPGKEIVLLRNDHYRGPQPAVSRARFLVLPDADERLRRLKAGEIDVADEVPLAEIGKLADDARLRTYHGSSNRLLLLCLRVNSGPLRDPRVREAIDRALDRDELVERVYGGRAEAARQVIHPRVVGYDPDWRPDPPDPDKARALLAQAGFARGLDVRLDGPRNRYTGDVELLEEVRRQLGRVGIRVAVSALDKADFFQRVDAGESDFHLMGWAFDTGESGDALLQLFHTQKAGLFGTLNTMGLSDPELDALIQQARGSRGESERARLLRSAARRAAGQRSVLPLVIQPNAVAMTRRLAWQPPLSFALRLTDLAPDALAGGAR